MPSNDILTNLHRVAQGVIVVLAVFSFEQAHATMSLGNGETPSEQVLREPGAVAVEFPPGGLSGLEDFIGTVCKIGELEDVSTDERNQEKTQLIRAVAAELVAASIGPFEDARVLSERWSITVPSSLWYLDNLEGKGTFEMRFWRKPAEEGMRGSAAFIVLGDRAPEGSIPVTLVFEISGVATAINAKCARSERVTPVTGRAEQIDVVVEYFFQHEDKRGWIPSGVLVDIASDLTGN